MNLWLFISGMIMGFTWYGASTAHRKIKELSHRLKLAEHRMFELELMAETERSVRMIDQREKR